MFPAAPCVLVGGGTVADLHCHLSHSSFYSGHQPEAIQCENGNTYYHSYSRLAKIKLASDDIYIYWTWSCQKCDLTEFGLSEVYMYVYA